MNERLFEFADEAARINERSFAFADRMVRKNERTDAVADGSAKMKQNSFGIAESKNRLYNLQNTKRIMAELNRRNIHDVANAFHFNMKGK